MIRTVFFCTGPEAEELEAGALAAEEAFFSQPMKTIEINKASIIKYSITDFRLIIINPPQYLSQLNDNWLYICRYGEQSQLNKENDK